MTVKELIAALQKVDPEAQVLYPDLGSGGEYLTIDYVHTTTAVESKDSSGFTCRRTDGRGRDPVSAVWLE